MTNNGSEKLKVNRSGHVQSEETGIATYTGFDGKTYTGWDALKLANDKYLGEHISGLTNSAKEELRRLVQVEDDLKNARLEELRKELQEEI